MEQKIANKAIVFAYGEWGCCAIEALQAAGYEITQVYTHLDNPLERLWGRNVAWLCAEYQIPCAVLDDSAIDMIVAAGTDFIFSFHYRDMLPLRLLQAARRGAYNQHPSLLPRYRGRAPVNWAVLRGETETGVSLHEMVEKPDAGGLIAQARLAIDPDEDAHMLNQRLLALSIEMLADVLPRLLLGQLKAVPMDLLNGNYVGRRRPEDGWIDWNKPALEIYNLIRAVCWPWPGAFWDGQGQRYFIWQALRSSLSGEAGKVLSVDPLVIAAAEGAIEVLVAQCENGLYLSGVQLARHYGWQVGDSVIHA